MVAGYTSPALRLPAARISVLVAKRLIHKGTAGDVLAKATGFDRVVGIPKSQVESGAIVNPATLSGKVALHDIPPGSQLTLADFGDAASHP